MKCTYETTIDGVRMLFNSEQELDSFLANRFRELKMSETDPTLQIDPVQTAVDKIDAITKKIKDAAIESVVINEDGDSETVLKIPDSIGATRFITSFGNPDNFSSGLVTPFNLQEYLDKKRSELVTDGLSKQEIDKTLENMQKSWKQLTEYGTEVHALFESLINKDKQFVPKNLTAEQVSSLTEEFKVWIEELKQKHGKNAKFFTEVPVISDKIEEAYIKAGIKSINGRIDLLVVDERGYANIYDFKVSRKPVGIWEQTQNINPTTWHSTKKLTAGYQLAIYKAILNQYGITVGNTEIIPIKIDPEYTEDGLIEKLDNVYIQKDSIKNRPYNTTNWHNITAILPVKTLMDGVDLTATIQEPMSKFVPNYEVETDIQRNEVTVDLYIKDGKTVHLIPEGDPSRSMGKYWIWNKYKRNKKVFCETDEDLQQAVTELVQAENAHRGSELSDLADTIQMAIEGYATVDDLANDNRFKADYCKRIFRKYIEGGWEFQNNPDFIAAGIFVFTKNGLLEVVSLHHNTTHALVNLGKGNTLLGATKLNMEVDEHETLKATNGNIDLIKVMTLLNGVSEILKSYKVNKIASYNIWSQHGTETYLETLFDNFAELCRVYNVPLNLDINNFASTLESTVNTIRDTCGEDLVRNIGNWTFTFSPNDIVYGVPFILNRMQELRSLNTANGLRDALRTGRWDFDDPLQLAYMMLGKALDKLNGYDIYIEKDPAKWVSMSKTEGWYSGSYVNSAGTSSSLNIQSLGKIFSVAETHIRRKELSYRPRIAKTIKAFYEYKHRSALIGGEVKFFDNLFVTDENGNIDKSFRLKDPKNSNLAKEEKDFINMFLEIVNELKFNGDIDKITNAKETGEYYEVPLAIGETRTQIHNKGFSQAIKAKYNESINFLRILPQQESSFEETRAQQKVYNKFRLNGLSRTNLIDSYGVNGFETQLENLLLSVIHTYTTEDVMNEYLPRLQGIKIALQYNQQMYGVATDNVIEYIDKFIDVNAYGKPIMDKQLREVYKCLSTVKSITTATALGLNMRSGVREMMQGIWMHISRTMANAYGKDQFNKSDVAKAWGIIFKQSTTNLNTLTLVDALNVEYGMANADPHQVQERLSQSRAGIKNLNSDTLYIFNRVPDAYHRLGLVIAKMIHEGCWEAHSIVNDELVYDFKKDSRFSLLHDNNADKESAKYKKQKALYTTMREQFNREGWNLQDGDALPRAYTIQESTSIKSFAEMCFGHYDRSTQMLMKHMFLGALMLQFRTFLSAKMEQWILKPGTYNQGKYAEKFNEDGIRYVRIYDFDENGIPSVRIDLETNLKEGDKWEPYIEWQGRFMEGMAYSIFSFGKELFTLDFKGLQELWKNDTKRANFYLFLNDMIFMSILMWIIKACWLTEDNDLGPVGHLVGTAMYTSFADGPIHQVATSMFGDLNPPAYGILKNIYNNTSAMVTGDKNVWDAATGTFGMLNDLRYIGNKLE